MNTKGLLTMNQIELKRYEVIAQVVSGVMKQRAASDALGVTLRQVKRLCQRYRQAGVAGLVSKKRGARSNHQLSVALREQILTLAHHQYAGFGPTFMAEKLNECHALRVGKETLRKMLINANLWKAKRGKKRRVHPRRARRSCFGELVQIDGSPHHWFEDRGAACCLIVFIDDATSEIIYLQFEEVETTMAYFKGIAAHIEMQGVPLAYYSDKHSIFRVNHPGAIEANLTQFERACEALGIETICAHSPQAKGRVERANRTLQDRLVKELMILNVAIFF